MSSHDKGYSIQLYGIKLVGHMRWVSGCLWVFLYLPTVTLNATILYKYRVNSDGSQYANVNKTNNHLSLYIIEHKERPRQMILGIHVPAWDRHKHKARLNWLIGTQPSELVMHVGLNTPNIPIYNKDILFICLVLAHPGSYWTKHCKTINI